MCVGLVWCGVWCVGGMEMGLPGCVFGYTVINCLFVSFVAYFIFIKTVKGSQLGTFFRRPQCTVTLNSNFVILKHEIVFN